MNKRRLLLTLTLNATILAGLSTLVPAALAQDQAPDGGAGTVSARHDRQPPSPQQVVDRMGTRLNLTDDQKQQLLPIVTDRQQKLQALRGDSSLRRRQKRHEFKSIMEDSDKKITAVLNDQQKEQYAQMKKEARDRMKERRQNR